MGKKNQVLIIGLDGFTWRLGRGFMAEGVMPYLAALVELAVAKLFLQKFFF